MMVVATADRKVGPSKQINRNLVQPCVIPFQLGLGVSKVGIDFLPFCVFFLRFVFFFFAARLIFDILSSEAFCALGNALRKSEHSLASARRGGSYCTACAARFHLVRPGT